MKWFLILLVACAVLAAVLLVRPSPLVVTNEPAAAKNILPPPAATPAPRAEVPLEKTPEPPEEIATLPPTTPAPQPNLAALAQNRALWPKQVLLAKPVVFPVVINQRPMGTVTLSPGRSVDVLAVSLQGLTLAFQGGTRLVPADSTNVMEAARLMHLPTVTSGAVPSSQGVVGLLPPTTSPRPAARAPALPSLPPGWSFVADRMMALKGRQLLTQYLEQKREGSAPAKLEAPDWENANFWALEQLRPLRGDPPQFYTVASGTLGVAVALLSSAEPLQRRKGLVIALGVAESSATYLQDYDLSTVIAELYLFPNVALATPARGSYRNQSDVADTLPMLINPQDYPRKKRAFELLMKFADNPSIADSARYRLASVAYQHGKKADALALLRAIKPSVGMSGARSLIPSLEEEMKQKKMP